MNRSFLVLFSKKNRRQRFFLKKEAKTFVNWLAALTTCRSDYMSTGPNRRLFRQLEPLVCAPGWSAAARKKSDSDTYGPLTWPYRSTFRAVGIS